MAEDNAQSDPRRQVTLAEVLGHDPLRDYLHRAIQDGSLPQAVLICGASGVGKRTLAWALARELAAEGSDARTHRGSLKIARGTHPDVMVIGGNSTSGQIKVDDIRDMIAWTDRYPIEAAHKIGVIFSAERMNESSANALLKLLEEPPHHLRLILTTPDAARVLTTIRSRCTPLILEPVAPETLVPWLMARASVGKELASLAAKISEGRPGHALGLIAGGGFESRGTILRELMTLHEFGFASVFGVAERLVPMGGDAAEILRMTAMILRDALWIAMGRDGVLNVDMQQELAAFGARLAPEGIFEAAQIAESAASEIADYYVPAGRAHFIELLVMRLGQAMKKAA